LIYVLEIESLNFFKKLFNGYLGIYKPLLKELSKFFK